MTGRTAIKMNAAERAGVEALLAQRRHAHNTLEDASTQLAHAVSAVLEHSGIDVESIRGAQWAVDKDHLIFELPDAPPELDGSHVPPSQAHATEGDTPLPDTTGDECQPQS